MPRWEVPIGVCDRCGTHNTLVKFRNQMLCEYCLNPEPPKQRATDFLTRTDEAGLTRSFGEKFSVGDIMEIQLGIKQKSRLWNKKHAKKLAADKRKQRAKHEVP